MVEKINGGNYSTNSKITNPNKRPSTSMEGWNTTWLGMPNTTHAHKIHEVMNS